MKRRSRPSTHTRLGSSDRGARRAPADEEALEELLSAPHPAATAALRRCGGDVIVLGAGGKMGPTLARMARRAADAADGAPTRRVVAVSRWSSGDGERAAERLRAYGVDPVRCDLTDRRAVAALPDAPNVVFMAGQKFGTRDDPSVTWMMNVVVPAICAERYADARVVAFSTGNVYPLTPVAGTGSRETDPLAPVGEYASSCVGRERVFEYYARHTGTHVALVRLNYAVDLRYGVLVDVALKVVRGEPVPLAMAAANVIWQGDANGLALACLAHAASPPFVVNVTGPVVRVRDAALRLGELLGRPVEFTGEESPDALLSDTSHMRATVGEPSVTPELMVAWIADWVRRGERMLAKPTHFERRDGSF